VRTIECSACGTSFEAQSPRATYCSAACRKRGSRAGVKASVEPIRVDPDEVAPLLEATKRELEAAGVANTALGQQAIELARRMSDPRAMGLSVAPISKELRSVMAEAMKDAPVASGLDELRARRDRKRHAG
jgi:hypothetical protein